MGSFLNVNVFQGELSKMVGQLKEYSASMPIYGAVLDGQSAKAIKLSSSSGLLIIGSESHGISDPIKALCSDKITIAGKGKAESLNASIAAAVLLSDWMED